MNKLNLCPLIFLVTLQSCSSPQYDKCSSEKWDTLGISLGQDGKDYKENEYIQSCQKIGVKPDMEKLEKGYNEGLTSYCTPQRFRESAEKGDALLDSLCPSDLSKILQKETNMGLKIHCTKEGALDRGLSNKLNKDVCPPKFKQTYNKYYSEGLRKHLNLSLSKSKVRSAQIQKKISEMDLVLHKKQVELNSIREYEVRENSKDNRPNDFDKTLHLFDSSPATLESEIRVMNEEKEVLLKENIELTSLIAAEELKLSEMEK